MLEIYSLKMIRSQWIQSTSRGEPPSTMNSMHKARLLGLGFLGVCMVQWKVMADLLITLEM